jgi:hypothetical protein
LAHGLNQTPTREPRSYDNDMVLLAQHELFLVSGSGNSLSQFFDFGRGRTQTSLKLFNDCGGALEFDKEIIYRYLAIVKGCNDAV